MDWPAFSPDLNPIKHVWDKLGRRIAARQPPPTCLPELRRALLDEWCNSPQDQIDNLILSMPRRWPRRSSHEQPTSPGGRPCPAPTHNSHDMGVSGSMLCRIDHELTADVRANLVSRPKRLQTHYREAETKSFEAQNHPLNVWYGSLERR
ncbi:transposable element Tcb1 transposase [Trichonephila clavipes]|nr:transposable element Tcb1 transposase [Trichonephila clavipes]